MLVINKRLLRLRSISEEHCGLTGGSSLFKCALVFSRFFGLLVFFCEACEKVSVWFWVSMIDWGEKEGGMAAGDGVCRHEGRRVGRGERDALLVAQSLWVADLAISSDYAAVISALNNSLDLS
ncbi:hypothetical protein NE237_030159 [Protea cynaroides]|uniref:Uncharacterized protein n=1 Tax=Protea cynaroides TaxID=273540 RepID=A0A9Q0JVS8_9MAGN|nr:hypothetical protein NE237_030159 [Protea cynaroides]